MSKVYLPGSVLDAARERIARVFEGFENIVVSVSGGKDSTALFWLCVEEAERRGRRIKAFFLDQEAEYAATIEVVDEMMRHPAVEPMWFQVPIKMTNATSFEDEFLYAWGPGEPWMREKHPLAIHSIPESYPERFYDFFAWLEQQTPDTAFMIGLRAEESLNRFRAVVKNPGWNGLAWSTKTPCPTTFRFNPIFDWGAGDVWKYINESDRPYNAIYDKMYAAGHGIFNTMRVSNLIHEKSFSALTSLQEFEPDTFDAIVRRLKGAHVASIYADEDRIFSTRALPAGFSTWRDYRDYLLATTPLRRRERFEKRFGGQEASPEVYRQQCRQLMLNDWENNVPPTQRRAEKKRETLAKWRALL